MAAQPAQWRDLALRFDRGLTWVEAAFIGAALAFGTLLLFVNVVLRYVFHAPLGWAEELTIYLIVWVVMIGGSVGGRVHGHN
jgi:C4-dicarboxylate transporter DctQ subunit